KFARSALKAKFPAEPGVDQLAVGVACRIDPQRLLAVQRSGRPLTGYRLSDRQSRLEATGEFAGRARRPLGADRLVRTGGWHDNRSAVNSDGMVLESLVSTCARRDRHDGDLVAAICVDAVHRAAEPEAGDDACGAAVDILAADHPADLVLAAAGLSRRQVRP